MARGQRWTGTGPPALNKLNSKSSLRRACRAIRLFAEAGISTNALTRRNVAGFMTSATLWGVTNPISESTIPNDLSFDATKFKEDLVREMTERDYGTQSFKRGYKWEWPGAKGYSNTIDSSLTAEPLDAPPPLSDDPKAAYALKQYSSFFVLTSPIDVNMFEFLLRDHPNRPFVESVVQGLREGFWPMADLPSEKVSFVKNHQVCNQAPDLLTKACKEEVEAGRYSEGFHTLLPGMKVSPLLLVAKKGSSNMRVCTDMSYGKPSLNDHIIKDRIKVSFHSLISFAPYMVEMAKKGIPLMLWKSDVQNAYRILAMALAWQLRQIVCVDNMFHVDRCANFGSAASPKIWCLFFSLVLWIARTRMGISRMNNLMDDTWGVAPLSSMVVFKGHQVPLDQAKLLLLFDVLNIPWEWKKQVHGVYLEIIGHLVRSKELSFSLPDDKKANLVMALRTFTLTKSRSLRNWQSLLGWASWGLNSFPLGRWALQSSWEKIAGKSHKFLVVPHNKTVQKDLSWLADCLEKSTGNLFLEAVIWSVSEADFLCTADACPSRLGVWLPNTVEGFHFALPVPSRDIYWAELAAT
ncbi:uncharacterized protein MELLADRAFT_95712 [Melampsora larici-populina 98AG31]|uniref:Reverse transcriptase domain-containing protein n=1 Tax=Melampsora larici-populina (strain 98AG31 / pathotype 3-4-7) TaxID=747676 RepID=F4SAC6_MELLP|nr:uncharacterized protein MELLADRAFT_95712 [Melampsora larici-populina 98AG31]EGF98364.1 hypothetical protein MELLADRAFT_95712 [Melampsora larici-populina 98AG31]